MSDKKVCPIMSTVKEGSYSYPLVKVYCLEAECMALEEPCEETSCEGCEFKIEHVECYAKEGHCRMCEGP